MSRNSSTATTTSLSVVLRWRCWPLGDYAPRSWLIPLAVVLVGLATSYAGGWWMGALAVFALTASLWRFFVPVTYEIDSMGIRWRGVGRARMVPWHGVRAFRVQTTGIVLFQRPDPVAIDSLRGFFLPYGDDVNQTQSVVRQFLAHAVELPDRR